MGRGFSAAPKPLFRGSTSGKSATRKVVVEPSSPVRINSIRTYYYYNWDLYSLFVTPENLCATKTVKTFNFSIACCNSSGKHLRTCNCEWSEGGSRSFGPKKTGNSGSWHRYDLYCVICSSYQEFTVTRVTFTDGTTRFY